MFNANGQNWGLTTFSPRALRQRLCALHRHVAAALRHAGGVRIDHAMGLMRLWVIPQRRQPTEGAYLPIRSRICCGSPRSNRFGTAPIVIGEDLGTVPAGFRERLAGAGIYGMRVLWFERTGRTSRRRGKWPRTPRP